MEASSADGKITVLIPVRNGIAFIEDALNSILTQTLPHIKLIVSDNDSTDGTLAVLEKYQKTYPQIIIKQQKNLSMLEHFNKCLAFVDTEYYMLLCHDDYVTSPEAMALAANILAEQPDVSAVYCDLDYVDRSGKHISTRKLSTHNTRTPREIALQSIRTMRNQFGIPLLIRTSARQHHVYDTALPYLADVEMSCHLGTSGSAHYIPQAFIANRYHTTNSTRALHGDTINQMKNMAAIYKIQLDWRDNLLMHANSLFIAGAKHMFFKYIELRQWMSRG
ncbi:MAG: glycosyltransferase [Polaromonas sp.]|nr:glycosyltransferase [Polaromonas sp.]